MASQLPTNTTRSGKLAQQVEHLSGVAYIRLSAISSDAEAIPRLQRHSFRRNCTLMNASAVRLLVMHQVVIAD